MENAYFLKILNVQFMNLDHLNAEHGLFGMKI